jgi:hypothetical protein
MRLLAGLLFTAITCGTIEAQTCDPNVDFYCVIQPAPCDYGGGYVVLKISTISCALEQSCQSGLVCVFDYNYYDVYYGTTCDDYEVVACAAPGTGASKPQANPLVPDSSPEVIPALLLLHLPHYKHVYPSHPVRQVNLSTVDRRFWWRRKI